jgi:hypothetical protein
MSSAIMGEIASCVTGERERNIGEVKAICIHTKYKTRRDEIIESQVGRRRRLRYVFLADLRAGNVCRVE